MKNIYFLKASGYVKLWLIILIVTGSFVSGQIFVQKGASISLKGNALIAVTDTAKTSAGTPKTHLKKFITKETETSNLKYVSNTEIHYYPEKGSSAVPKIHKKPQPKIYLKPENQWKNTALPAEKKKSAPNYTQNPDSQQNISAGNVCHVAAGLPDHYQKNSAEPPVVLYKIILIFPENRVSVYRKLPAQYLFKNVLFIRPPPAVFSI